MHTASNAAHDCRFDVYRWRHRFVSSTNAGDNIKHRMFRRKLGTEMILFVGVVVPISDTHCISYDEIRDRKSNCEQDQRFRAADAIHVFSLIKSNASAVQTRTVVATTSSDLLSVSLQMLPMPILLRGIPFRFYCKRIQVGHAD